MNAMCVIEFHAQGKEKSSKQAKVKKTITISSLGRQLAVAFVPCIVSPQPT